MTARAFHPGPWVILAALLAATVMADRIKIKPPAPGQRAAMLAGLD